MALGANSFNLSTVTESARWSDTEVLAAFPNAEIGHDNIHHYRGRLERKLLVNRCRDCGTWHEPPRPVCANCWSDRVEATEVSGRGRVSVATVLHVGPPAPAVDYEAGYPLVAVDLVEQAGLRYTAGVIDVPADQVCIDMPVELAWVDRAGELTPAFRRADSA